MVMNPNLPLPALGAMLFWIDALELDLRVRLEKLNGANVFGNEFLFRRLLTVQDISAAGAAHSRHRCCDCHCGR